METVGITRAGGGEHFQVLTDAVTIKASGRNTSDRLLLLEVLVPPGEGPPALHRHEYAEIFYVLSGEFEFSTTDAKGEIGRTRLRGGDSVALPSMAWHNFKNVGQATGRLLAIHSSAVMEKFVQEVGVPIDDPLNPPSPGGPPSEEQMKNLLATVRRYMEIMPGGK